jgi:hypothetical protein
MAIAYALYENYLTDEPDDYTARAVADSTVDKDEMIDEIIRRDSTVGKVDLMSVLELYEEVIILNLLRGRNVSTPLCNFRSSVKGVFVGDQDVFDKDRHDVSATAYPGTRVRIAYKNASVVKVDPRITQPVVKSFIDTTTKQRNESVTVLGLGQLTGSRLKFNQEDAAQGVYFVASDGTETRVQNVAYNKPGEVIFHIPELTAGDYTIKLRTKFTTEEIREGVLKVNVNVT